MGSSVVMQASNRELCVRTEEGGEEGGDEIPRPIGTVHDAHTKRRGKGSVMFMWMSTEFLQKWWEAEARAAAASVKHAFFFVGVSSPDPNNVTNQVKFSWSGVKHNQNASAIGQSLSHLDSLRFRVGLRLPTIAGSTNPDRLLAQLYTHPPHVETFLGVCDEHGVFVPDSDAVVADADTTPAVVSEKMTVVTARKVLSWWATDLTAECR